MITIAKLIPLCITSLFNTEMLCVVSKVVIVVSLLVAGYFYTRYFLRFEDT